MTLKQLLPFFAIGVSCSFTSNLLADHPEPVAWWDMEPQTLPDMSVIVQDISGNGHHAVVFQSPVFGFDGEIKRSFIDFNGTGWLEAADHPDLDLLGDWTVTMWVKPGPLAVGNELELWISKVKANADAQGGYSLLASQRPTGERDEATMVIYGPGGNPMFRVPANPLNIWTHLSFVFDSSTSTASTYSNGIFVGSMVMRTMLNNTYDVAFGGYRDTDGLVNPNFIVSQGSMGDVRIFNVQLTEKDLKKVMKDKP